MSKLMNHPSRLLEWVHLLTYPLLIMTRLLFLIPILLSHLEHITKVESLRHLFIGMAAHQKEKEVEVLDRTETMTNAKLS